MDERYIRQQELVNQEKLAGLHVAIVGCGAVGSFTALSLCPVRDLRRARKDNSCERW